MHFFFVPRRITLFPTARGPFYVSKYDSKFGGLTHTSGCGGVLQTFPSRTTPPFPAMALLTRILSLLPRLHCLLSFSVVLFYLPSPPLPPGNLSHLIIVGRSKGTWCGGGWGLSMVFSSPRGIIIPHIMMVVVSHFTTC